MAKSVRYKRLRCNYCRHRIEVKDDDKVWLADLPAYWPGYEIQYIRVVDLSLEESLSNLTRWPRYRTVLVSAVSYSRGAVCESTDHFVTRRPYQRRRRGENGQQKRKAQTCVCIANANSGGCLGSVEPSASFSLSGISGADCFSAPFRASRMSCLRLAVES